MASVSDSALALALALAPVSVSEPVSEPVSALGQELVSALHSASVLDLARSHPVFSLARCLMEAIAKHRPLATLFDNSKWSLASIRNPRTDLARYWLMLQK